MNKRNSNREKDSVKDLSPSSGIIPNKGDSIVIPVTGDSSEKIFTKDNTTFSSGKSDIKVMLIDGNFVAQIKYNTRKQDIIKYLQSIPSNKSVTFIVYSTNGLSVRDIINLKEIFLESGRKVFINQNGNLDFVGLAFMIALSTEERRSILSTSEIIMDSPIDIDDTDLKDMAELISEKTLYKTDNIVADYTTKVTLTSKEILEYKIAHYYSDTYM